MNLLIPSLKSHLNYLNDKLAKRNIKAKFEITEIETLDEIGLRITIPTISDNNFDILLVERYRESSYKLSEIYNNLNLDAINILESAEDYVFELIQLKEDYEMMLAKEVVNFIINSKIKMNQN